MEVKISCIDENDLVDCANLYVRTFKEAPWNEDWSLDDALERLSDFSACPNTIALKAVKEGAICGFLIGEVQRWNSAKFYYLKEICVCGETQRQGVGKHLMKKLETIMKEQEIMRVYLITQRNSFPAEFYASLQFSENKHIMVMGKSVE